MKREDVLSKMFDAEFCEPKDKAAFERELNAIWEEACAQTQRPMHSLRLAFLKVYPRYRKERLAKEFPNLPSAIRGQ